MGLKVILFIPSRKKWFEISIKLYVGIKLSI